MNIPSKLVIALGRVKEIYSFFPGFPAQAAAGKIPAIC
jgi:hypothetical protein